MTDSDAEGRSFRLAKFDRGTDKEESTYSVYCSFRDPNACLCDCKGFARHGHCKHLDAAQALNDNGWLTIDQTNPDTDVSNTEHEDADLIDAGIVPVRDDVVPPCPQCGGWLAPGETCPCTMVELRWLGFALLFDLI
jgi:hypothetical protein